MDLSLLEALEKEERLFKKFSFVGTDEVVVAGNLKAGFLVNVNRQGGVESPTPVLNCPTGDTVTVAFSDIVSCGCLTGGGNSYLGTDLGGINASFTLTRFSATEFHVIVPN